MNISSLQIADGTLLGLLVLRAHGLDRIRLFELVRARGGLGRVTPADLESAGFVQLSADMRSPHIVAALHTDLARWARDGIAPLPFGSPTYPPLLAPLSDPPPVLFVMGESDNEIFKKPTLGIVGSRRGDAIGCAFAGEVAADFAARGGCVVSGLAVGIDGAAHRGALQGEPAGSTIAVLGAGFYSIYPAMHRPLAREIVSGGGLLVSQFEPEAKPFPANFLNRNRIIAGLSLGVLVVQAAGRSGALVTARCALDEGRELLVVPGGIRDPLYEGSNRLLRVGAVPITSLSDLFESFPVTLAPVRSTPSRTQFSPEQMRLLESLAQQGTCGVQELVQQHGAKLYEDLLDLELKGLVARLPGNLVQLVGEYKNP